MFSTYPEMVTNSNMCEMLNISKNSAYALLRSGQVKYVRVGRKYLIPKSHIIDFISKKMS